MAGREEAVIDASVAVKWFSNEEGTDDALKLRDEHVAGNIILSTPVLFIYEIANALRFKPGFNDEKVGRAISDIFDLQVDLIAPSGELVKRSSELAFRYDVTVYDSCYLALAELMGISLYTSDNRFYENTRKSGLVKFL
jgi:predicted nucleic acid-binding protein